MAGINLGPDHDLAVRLQKMEDDIAALSTRDVLQFASIGKNGLTVNGGGSIMVTGGGSITVSGGGSISLTGGAFSANSVSATTTLNSTGDTNVGGNANVTGSVNVPNSTLISAYARAHSVTTGYAAAYINSDGSFLATISSARYKRDVLTKSWTAEERSKLRVVAYALRAAYILADMRGEDLEAVERRVGVIAEEMAEAGFEEFVIRDDRGRVHSVHYELIGLIALDGTIQQDAEIGELRKEVGELRAKIEG